MRKASILVAAVAAAALLVPATASAAPKADPTQTISVDCTGTRYDGTVIAVPGDGNWTPVFVGHTTFIPVSFGAFTGTFTPTAGGTPFTFTDPPHTQNENKGGNNERLACSYTFTGTSPEGTFFGTGTVVVAIVGKR